MTRASAGPMVLFAEQPVDPSHLAIARKLIDELTARTLGGRVPNQQKSIQLPDGTAIRVRLNGALPQVTIVEPESETTETTDLATQWVPRGFVVYPAWHDKPFGVGLPVVQQGADPYAATNLSPGLDPTRWTAGGPCGEVLLSPDDQAGYPDAIFVPAPLLADATQGPQSMPSVAQTADSADPTGAWAAYRWEMAPFIAHSASENTAVQTSLFATVNLARQQAGVTPASMRLRGFARVAEIAANILATAGSVADTSTSYPLAYQSAADRVTKEGYACDLANVSTTTFDRTQLVATAEFRAAGLLPAAAVALWQSQPNTLVTRDLGAAATLDIGYVNGTSVAVLASRDRWIQAGNMCWQSPDTTLPPISWHGFATINLAWETYPAVYNIDTYQTAPLSPTTAFTTATGDCWLQYPRSTAPATATNEPAMGRHLYSRGRSIAMAPRGGLFWGACVQVVPTKTGDVDRLITLVHHPEDQSADYTNNGWTRYLRVWWADIPRRASGQRLAPQLTICGEDPNDPWGWRGGMLVDVGHMPAPSTGGTVSPDVCSSLKYASQWRFADDGTRAICLRDYGTYADYSSLFAVVGVQTQVGKFPRAVELTFDTTSSGVNVGTTFHDYTPGAFATPRPITGLPLTGAMAGLAHQEQGSYPLAVDYDDAGRIIYAYVAYVTGVQANYNVVYVGLGTGSATYVDDLAAPMLAGADHQLGQGGVINFTATRWHVVDVRRAAFLIEGVRPNIAAAVNPNGSFSTTPLSTPCFPFTGALVHGVRVYEAGKPLRDDWYAAPDGAIFTLATGCDSAVGADAVFVELPLAQSNLVQPFRVERFAQRVFGYQVAPIPGATWALNAAPTGTCGCRLDYQQLSATHRVAFNELVPRGGACVSDVGLPANDWLIYAKVV